MLRSIRGILKRTYYPLNTVHVFTERVNHNYRYLQTLNRNISVAPVLKSNAYGHGLTEMGKIVDRFHPPFICVDSLYEAYELLKAGVKSKILIMGFVHPDNLKTKRLPFLYAIWDADVLRAIKGYQPDATFHLFIDTGMHREGISIDNLSAFLKKTKTHHRSIIGLMSHLAMSQSKSVTRVQLRAFEQAQDLVKAYGIYPQHIHTLASGGLLHCKEYGRFPTGNVARTGMALYGIHPEYGTSPLRPTLRLNTKIVQIRNVKKGESVGYDCTFTTKRNILIGIIPMGYHDGIDRRLSNKGIVLVKEKPCRIIGRVSMNITVVDLSNVGRIKVGEDVCVYSEGSPINSVETMAKAAGTIPYELLVHIDPSIRRVYHP